jgi:hypothetical protein
MAASYAVMMTSLFQTVKEQVEKENNETAKNLQLSSWKAVRSFMAAHGVRRKRKAGRHGVYGFEIPAVNTAH